MAADRIVGFLRYFTLEKWFFLCTVYILQFFALLLIPPLYLNQLHPKSLIFLSLILQNPIEPLDLKKEEANLNVVDQNARLAALEFVAKTLN